MKTLRNAIDLRKAINLKKVNRITIDFYEHIDLLNRYGEGRLLRVHKNFVEVLQDKDFTFFKIVAPVKEDEKTYKKHFKIL